MKAEITVYNSASGTFLKHQTDSTSMHALADYMQRVFKPHTVLVIEIVFEDDDPATAAARGIHG